MLWLCCLATQACLMLCNPLDSSPVSSVHVSCGILEWLPFPSQAPRDQQISLCLRHCRQSLYLRKPLGEKLQILLYYYSPTQSMDGWIKGVEGQFREPAIKLYTDFWLQEKWAPLTPLFKGQLYFPLWASIKTSQITGGGQAGGSQVSISRPTCN